MHKETGSSLVQSADVCQAIPWANAELLSSGPSRTKQSSLKLSSANFHGCNEQSAEKYCKRPTFLMPSTITFEVLLTVKPSTNGYYPWRGVLCFHVIYIIDKSSDSKYLMFTDAFYKRYQYRCHYYFLRQNIGFIRFIESCSRVLASKWPENNNYILMKTCVRILHSQN